MITLITQIIISKLWEGIFAMLSVSKNNNNAHWKLLHIDTLQPKIKNNYTYCELSIAKVYTVCAKSAKWQTQFFRYASNCFSIVEFSWFPAFAESWAIRFHARAHKTHSSVWTIIRAKLIIINNFEKIILHLQSTDYIIFRQCKVIIFSAVVFHFSKSIKLHL